MLTIVKRDCRIFINWMRLRYLSIHNLVYYMYKQKIFNRNLTPGIPPEAFQEVRVPKLRKIEKQFRKTREGRDFLVVILYIGVIVCILVIYIDKKIKEV